MPTRMICDGAQSSPACRSISDVTASIPTAPAMAPAMACMAILRQPAAALACVVMILLLRFPMIDKQLAHLETEQPRHA